MDRAEGFASEDTGLGVGVNMRKLSPRLAKSVFQAAGVGLLALGVIGPALAQQAAPPATPESAQAAEPASAAEADVAPNFNRDLLTVEEQVNGLKERVFRSKATLQLLKEIVIQGTTSGAAATIWHVNRLGNAYTVESLSYFLDGQNKFSKTDPEGSLSQSKEFKVFEGAIPPGDHSVTVNVRLRGNGFGIFKYVENYEVNFKANSMFTAEEGKACQVQVVLERQKGIGRSFTERPNVAFETRCTRQEESGEQR